MVDSICPESVVYHGLARVRNLAKDLVKVLLEIVPETVPRFVSQHILILSDRITSRITRRITTTSSLQLLDSFLDRKYRILPGTLSRFC